MALAVGLVLLVVATVLFHVLSPWWFTPIASNWSMMDSTVNLTFWVTGAAFVLVTLFMAYAIIRFRHGRVQRAEYRPESQKLEWWLTIITSVGIIALLAPGLVVWAKFVTAPETAALVEVVGKQWNFSYRFPGADGKLGRTDAHLASADNPLGIDPDDPNGQDDIIVTGSELHLPVNKSVKVELRALDVLHQFAVPQFRAKMDMVPGMVTYFWLKPTRTGPYDVLCEQLCGIAHFAMRGRVVIDSAEDFRAWQAQQPTFAQLRSASAGDPVAGQATFALCSTCHGAHGEGNQQLNAPKLSGQAGWYLARQLRAFKQGVRGAGDPIAAQMAPMAATLADEAAIRNVVAYIATLPDAKPAATVSGDAARGGSLYVNCAACHGSDGQGVWSTNAPRLAHMSDWYLKRQLLNFRHGLRGGHSQDFNGEQMALMAKALADDRAVDDLVAHIDAL
jgi:cytochrome c oxidase subunit 2